VCGSTDRRESTLTGVFTGAVMPTLGTGEVSERVRGGSDPYTGSAR
jgi:hypothetical protein